MHLNSLKHIRIMPWIFVILFMESTQSTWGTSIHPEKDSYLMPEICASRNLKNGHRPLGFDIKKQNNGLQNACSDGYTIADYWNGLTSPTINPPDKTKSIICCPNSAPIGVQLDPEIRLPITATISKQNSNKPQWVICCGTLETIATAARSKHWVDHCAKFLERLSPYLTPEERVLIGLIPPKGGDAQVNPHDRPNAIRALAKKYEDKDKFHYNGQCD